MKALCMPPKVEESKFWDKNNPLFHISKLKVLFSLYSYQDFSSTTISDMHLRNLIPSPDTYLQNCVFLLSTFIHANSLHFWFHEVSSALDIPHLNFCMEKQLKKLCSVTKFNGFLNTTPHINDNILPGHQLIRFIWLHWKNHLYKIHAHGSAN